MKKVLICIFAHPDDEAFGPSGTLLKLKNEGYDVHLILFTDGDAGTNVDSVPNLGQVRNEEWLTSARILKADSTSALHYPDGQLASLDRNELQQQTLSKVRHITQSYQDAIELSILTFEPHGLTSHTDHITASQIATSIASDIHAKAIWYFCLDKTQAPLNETRYYFPKAREESYITHRIDVSAFLEKKLQMIDAHVSQRHDAVTMKKLDLTTECFHIDEL